MSIAVTCVLKTGGDFNMEDVTRLYKCIEQNTTVEHTFYCLTDANTSNKVLPFICLPLIKNFAGWWSKIELFKPHQFKEDYVLYFDLDTVILQNIDIMLQQERSFIGLDAFNPKHSNPNYVASGILFWKNDGKYFFLFQKFSVALMRKYRGDQDYISDALQAHRIKPCHWQKVCKGICSYKKHYLTGETLLRDITVLCFHGQPRPKEVWYA